MENLVGIEEIALSRSRDNDETDNVAFPPLSESEIREFAMHHNRKSKNVSALAAISNLCDNNPHATGPNFAMYTDDRFGPVIDEYDADIYEAFAAPKKQSYSSTTAPDYRRYALDGSDSDIGADVADIGADIGAELDDVNRQLASLSSDVSEMKSTLENMVNDVTETSQATLDTHAMLKNMESVFDSFAETVYEMKQSIEKHQLREESWRKRIDARLAALEKNPQ